MTSPLQALGIGSFLLLECLPWNVLRLQEGLLTNTGYAQGDNERGALSPPWSPFGTHLASTWKVFRINMSGWQGLANCFRKWREELDPAQDPAWLEVSKAVCSKTHGRGRGELTQW